MTTAGEHRAALWTTNEPVPEGYPISGNRTTTSPRDLGSVGSQNLDDAYRRHGGLRGFIGTVGSTLEHHGWATAGWETTPMVVYAPRSRLAEPVDTDGEERTEPSRRPDELSRQEFTGLVDEMCIGARLTREQVGQLLGVKRRTIQSWLSGQRVPRQEAEERVRRVHDVLKPVLAWRSVDVQRWMHSGTPSGFDLLLREDYSVFSEELEKAGWRRRVLHSQVRHVSGPQSRGVASTEPETTEAATPDELMSAWLSGVRQRTHMAGRQESGWLPEGYESALDNGDGD